LQNAAGRTKVAVATMSICWLTCRVRSK